MKQNLPGMIKAVIFDFDGLIVNSEPAWLQSHHDFIEKYDLDVTHEQRVSFRGIGLKELVMRLREQFQLDKSVEELLNEYREIFYKNFINSKEMHLLEGVEECVKMFSQQGYQLAIATGGHTPETMNTLLASFKLLEYFPVIVSCDEVDRGKPHPEVFLHTAEKLGRQPAECLVIEDSVNGVKAGKAARMLVFGINQDEKIYTKLKAAGADEVFHSLLEINI